MNHIVRRHTISFKNAFNGIKLAFQTQPNFRVHCLVAISVIALGFWLTLTQVEWAIIILTIVWILLTEMVNTAIESMVDLITTEYHAEAKVAKDVGAGAVLLGAIGAIFVAVFILLPKLLSKAFVL